MGKFLGISEKFPNFKLSAVVSMEKDKEFAEVSTQNDKWAVYFFWPLDFSFFCPTEIIEFNKHQQEFVTRDTLLFGVSCDSKFAHLAWRREHKDLKELKFPMISDYRKELSESLGILHPVEKVPFRATYIVDPHGTIRWVSVNDIKIGRNVKEVLRILDALQSDEFCPCNWQKGQATMKP